MIHVIVGTDVPSWITWLTMYLAHAAAWLAVGWLCCRPQLRLGARTHNLVWRAALVAPVLSASLLASGITPGRLATWEVGRAGARGPGGARGSSPAPLVRAVGLDDRDRVGTPPAVAVAGGNDSRALPAAGPGLGAGSAAAAPGGPDPVPEIAPRRSRRPELPAGSTLLLALLAAGAVLRLGRLGLAAARLRQRLSPRRPVVDQRAQQILSALGRRSRLGRAIWLTESHALACPVALGTREICLPARSIARLDHRALEAVLAHELGHLERRDNIWLLLGALIEATLWLPPLARFARRNMQDSAELACDDRAVGLTEDPVGLARSLAEVAAWSLEDADATPDLVHAIASPSRGLMARVERLLARDRHLPGTSWAGRAGGAALLLAVIVAAPAVRTAAAGPPPTVTTTSPIQVAAAPMATVPNDKPGAPRLPARPPARVLMAPQPAPEREPFDHRGHRFVPRGPRPPRPPGFPTPPFPHAALGEMVKQALAESRLAMGLTAARQNAERVHASGAAEPARRAADQHVAELEREHAEAKREHARHQGEFEREMEAWSKEINRRGEEFGRAMQAWGATLGAGDGDGRPDLSQHQEEQLKRNQERMKREAERLRREADRFEREAERMARDAVRGARPGWIWQQPPPPPVAPPPRPSEIHPPTAPIPATPPAAPALPSTQPPAPAATPAPASRPLPAAKPTAPPHPAPP